METTAENNTPVGVRERFTKHSQLLLITLIVSACSITYELLIAHSLALLAANAVIWYSLVIGLYLLGMGLGAFLVDRTINTERKRQAIWGRLLQVEISLSLFGFLAIPLLHLAHSLYAYLDYWNHTNAGLLIFFGTALILTLLIGIFTGIELPLLIEAGKEENEEGELTNTLLGIDYLGSLLGAVAFPLLLLPTLSVLTIGAVIASLNLFAATLIIFFFLRRANNTGALGIAAALLLSYGAVFTYEAPIEQFFLKRFYCYRLLSRSPEHFLSLGNEYPDILRVHSPYQQIDLLHDMEGDGSDPFVDAFSTKFSKEHDWPRNRLLFLNGDWQFHSNHEEVYHEWFAHLPIINTSRIPRNVLVLGGGDGLLIRELIRYREIESIIHVDLDKELIKLAKTNETLLKLNKNSLNDPRVKSIIGDGFQFVRESDEKFDAIYIDFPTPTNYDLSKLYSREFYGFVRQQLTPAGFMVFDSVSTGSLEKPNEQGKRALKKGNQWPIFSNTLQAAGFTRVIPYISTIETAVKEAQRLAESTYSKDEATGRIERHIRQSQQGFIMAGLPGTHFGAPYKTPPGEPLYVLNEERYALSFPDAYPTSSQIDYSKVNSIFRPRLAILPIWNARLPF